MQVHRVSLACQGHWFPLGKLRLGLQLSKLSNIALFFSINVAQSFPELLDSTQGKAVYKPWLLRRNEADKKDEGKCVQTK